MTKPAWQKHEEKVASALSGKVVNGSGNNPGNPGDVYNDDYLVEAKQTGNKSYALNANTWKKICGEATRRRRTPLMAVQIMDERLIVMRESDFLELRENAVSNEGTLSSAFNLKAEDSATNPDIMYHASGTNVGPLCGDRGGKVAHELSKVKCPRCLAKLRSMGVTKSRL